MILTAIYVNDATVVFLGIVMAVAMAIIGWIGASFYCEDCNRHDNEVQSGTVQGRVFDQEYD